MTKEDLLSLWQGAGRWESEGQFTIDPARALEKLRSHALPEPRRYILSLVSWSVAAGATANRGHYQPASSAPASSRSEAAARRYGQLVHRSSASRELAIATVSASSLPGAQVNMRGGGASLRIDRSQSAD